MGYCTVVHTVVVGVIPISRFERCRLSLGVIGKTNYRLQGRLRFGCCWSYRCFGYLGDRGRCSVGSQNLTRGLGASCRVILGLIRGRRGQCSFLRGSFGDELVIFGGYRGSEACLRVGSNCSVLRGSCGVVGRWGCRLQKGVCLYIGLCYC